MRADLRTEPSLDEPVQAFGINVRVSTENGAPNVFLGKRGQGMRKPTQWGIMNLPQNTPQLNHLVVEVDVHLQP